MTATTLAGLTGAALIGLGLYGVLVNVHALRKILAFNLIGSGVFLVFGLVARRGAVAGFAADPVPQAMVITGIVVAFSWWHVNFLNVGLHNYGFAAEKLWTVVVFYAIMSGFILLGAITWLMEKRAKSVKTAREFEVKKPVEV